MQRFNIILISLIVLAGSLSHSEIRTSLVAEDLAFISPDYTNGDNKNFVFVGANVKSNPKSGDAFRIDLTALYAAGNSVLSYLNLREIYYNNQVDEISSLQIGRRLEQWSALDSAWNLGVYQPQFRWNQLNPENQGLTGLFWSKVTESYGLTLFASPLYIPDQGAGYEIKDGQFQSGNPFFQAPPQNVRFQGKLLPIDYQVNKPDISSVIYQSEFGAQLRYGEAKGFFGNLAGIFKPSNQLALGYKGVLVTTRVRVDVTPKTYLENVYSGDVGYRDDWGGVLFSALYSKPKDPEFDNGFNAPHFEPSLSFGPQVLYKMKPFEFYAAYLDTSGGEISDVGPDASPDRASLSKRFLYRQAALVSATYSEVFFKQYKLDSMLQYKFSTKEGFRQIRFKNNVNLKGPWAFWMDLILIDTDSAVQGGLESYKSMDQVWLGASYEI